MKEFAIIVNPYAGRGKGKKLGDSIHRQFEKTVAPADLFWTRRPGHAQEIADDLKDRYSVLIVAGGDGTVHETVNGMMGGSAALGVIPIGSGNDFVKMLSLPKEPAEAIAVIAGNRRKKIDIGKAGDVYFPNGLGMGFDAWVVRESIKIKQLRGFLIYLYAVLKTVFSYRNQTVQLTLNGETFEKSVFLIAVGNGKAMGGGFYLTPDAEVDDGQLDICLIEALKKREVFRHLPKVLTGDHVAMPQVTMYQANQLKVVSPEGIAAHADGELMGMELKTIDISLLPGALEVIHNCPEQADK